MGLAPTGCCPAVDALYNPAVDALYNIERRTDAGMKLNDRLITGGHARCKTWATGTLAALIFGIGVAFADMPGGTRLEAIISQPRLDLLSAAPKVLSSNDVDRYRDIFRIQKDGYWPEANALIARLENPSPRSFWRNGSCIRPNTARAIRN